MFKLEDKVVAKEVNASILKLILSATPGGTFINEYIELRSRIKQERFNNFVSQLSEYLTNNKIEANADLKTEDFGDLFESVLRRVTATKSSEKHSRFRDILLNFMENAEVEIDEAEIFLDLANDLNDVTVIILKHHKIFKREFSEKNIRLYKLEQDLPVLNGKVVREMALKEKGVANDFDTVNRQRQDTDLAIKKLKVEIKELDAIKMPTFYNLDEYTFLYYKQILLSKGLLKDNFAGNTIGGSPFIYMTITEFGEKFIDFILRT